MDDICLDQTCMSAPANERGGARSARVSVMHKYHMSACSAKHGAKECGSRLQKKHTRRLWGLLHAGTTESEKT